MNCKDIATLLDDFVDSELDAAHQRAVRDHLDGCVACSRKVDRTQRLIDAAAGLPSSIEPERDLWPGIASRMSRPATTVSTPAHSSSWSLWLSTAAAATLFIAVLTGFMVHLHTPPDPSQALALATPSEEADLAPGGGAINQARARLQVLLERQREGIAPETMAVVDTNLGIISDTITGIRHALGRDPGNPRLSRMLLAAYEQEIGLLRRAVLLPDET